MGPGVPEDGEHVVSFDDVGGRRTRMTVVEHGYTTEDARQQSQAGLSNVLRRWRHLRLAELSTETTFWALPYFLIFRLGDTGL